ncbi:MAG: hypothetical protein JXR27_06575 [Paludibacteraceae bacterium]|nr:hypothetical protein [Paludibacteraceae bacterium]
MYNAKPMPHNGKLIESYALSRNFNRAELSRALSRNVNTVYRYAGSPSLQMRIMWNLSILMKHNFIGDLANKLEIDFETPKEIELKERLQKLEYEIQEMERTILSKDAEIEGYRTVMKNIRF